MKTHKLLLFLLTGQLLASGLAAQTADDLVSAGRVCLTTQNLTGAYSNFNAAVALSSTNETANALLAVTRLLVLPQQPAGSNFLNSLGFPKNGRNIYNWTSTLPKDINGKFILPTNNTSVAIAFYRTNIMVSLGAARTNLTQITDPNFTLSLTAAETTMDGVTVDYGDFLLLQAFERAAEFAGYTLNAHNFNVVARQLQLLSQTNGLTIQAVLANYPSLLNLSNTTDLASSKGVFTNVIALYQQASDFIRNVRPPGAVRLFNLDPGDLAKEAAFRANLTNVLLSLNAPTEISPNNANAIASTAYLGAYFSGIQSLRSLIPQFNGNAYVNDTLPDYAFGGIVPDWPAYQTEAKLRKMFYSYADIYGGHVYDLNYDDPYAGFFGVFIGTNGQATVTGYDIDSFQNINETQSGGVAAQFNVDSHGNWQFNSNSVAGVSGYGSVSKDGSFYGELDFTNGDSVSLNGCGQRAMENGTANNCYSCHDAGSLALRPFQSAAGNYGGTYSVKSQGQTFTGKLLAILFDAGALPFCFFDPSGAQNDGGAGLFGSNNKFTTTNATSGDVYTGTLNTSTFQITGTMTNSDGPYGGTYTLTRSASIPFDVPPAITTSLPSALNALLGTNVTLSLVTTGSPPMCYQWYFNGIAIPNATTNILVVSNLQYSSAGTYSVTINNAVGGTNFSTILHVSLTAPTTFYSFTATDPDTYTNKDGANPYAGLVLSGSTLYGTTAYGGTNGNGTVFKVNTNGSGYTVLHNFTTVDPNTYTNKDGAYSYASLVLSGSTLYGTTDGGGTNGNGTVFKVNTNGSGYTVLHTFTGGTDGAYPDAGLVVSGGTLYGTTWGGGKSGDGTVFSMNTNGTGFTPLYAFTDGTDGANPGAVLMLSGSTLYGTAANGGMYGDGTVFSMNTNGNGYTVLHTFNNDDGAYPTADLLLLGSTLYGTTEEGGANGYGTVFKVNTDGTGYVILHSFTADDPDTYINVDGAYPYAGLVLSGNTLYGTTWEGGSMGCGVVFGVSLDGSIFNTLYNFTGNPDGANSSADLILAGSTLYGTTADGGVNGNGTLFSLLIPPSPPVITAQPQSLIVSGSNSATFSVTASGTTPLFYQWSKDGTNLVNGTRISGATNNLLTVSNVQTNDAGSYLVVVTNAYGLAASSNAVLRVIPTNQTFWLPDYYFPIYAGNQWVYDSTGTGEGSKMMGLVDATSLSITSYTGCSPASPFLRNVIRFYWAYGDYDAGDDFNPVDAWYEYPTVDTGWGMAGSDDIPGPDAMRVNPEILITNRMTVGQSLSTNVQVYINGACNGQMTFQFQLVEVASMTVPAGTYPECLHVKYVVVQGSGAGAEIQTNNEWWAKGVGIVKKTRYAVKPDEVDNEEFDLSQASFVNPPRIITPPQSQTNSIGTAASFSVEAMGTTPLNYYWQKNGTNLSDGGNISGSAGTNLVIANVQFADAGSYSVVVSNAFGCVTSTPPAVLTVNDTTPPSLAITSHTDFQLLGVSAITLAGTASDAGRGDNGIASVTVNGIQATNDTASGSATANWTKGLNLSLGTNTISVIATDTRANAATNVIHIISDTAKPTNTITAPTAGQRWSNSTFTVTGTASDNVQVSSVVCQINGGGWSNAVGTTSWSALVNLLPGTNLVQAYAVDTVGNKSTTNSVSLDYVVTNQLQVRMTGRGTISPNYSNAWLEIGRNYSITSAPATGFVFTNWVTATNWIGGTPTTKTNLTFMMASNLTLQANFLDVTKPTLTITAPTAGQHMTNALATVVGTASDNWKVSAVWYQLTNKVLPGGTWALATTANNYTNWTTTVTLAAGTNTVKAYAVDLGGNYSATSSVSVLSSNTFKLQLSFALNPPLTSTGLNFTLQISSNLNGHLQISTNLLNWTPFTNFVGTNTTINFRDPQATNYNWRFYRAVIP